LFPATIVIEHPDFVSLLTLEPRTADRNRYPNGMLVPASRAGDTEHWRKNWHLIDENGFQREDTDTVPPGPGVIRSHRAPTDGRERQKMRLPSHEYLGQDRRHPRRQDRGAQHRRRMGKG
jgi:hypothetical protein